MGVPLQGQTSEQAPTEPSVNMEGEGHYDDKDDNPSVLGAFEFDNADDLSNADDHMGGAF